jgi:hypothetical protein
MSEMAPEINWGFSAWVMVDDLERRVRALEHRSSQDKARLRSSEVLMVGSSIEDHEIRSTLPSERSGDHRKSDTAPLPAHPKEKTNDDRRAEPTSTHDSAQPNGADDGPGRTHEQTVAVRTRREVDPNALRGSRGNAAADREPKTMSAAELKPFFNEVMRRKMKLRRANRKESP